MITALYASLLTLLLCFLTLRVIKARRANQIKYADGGVEELQRTRSAHSNATESIPIALILLLCLELNSGPFWLIHFGGIAFSLGRVIHARGILTDALKLRVLGMQLSIFTLLGLAAANVIFYFMGELL